jgi:hypothetical protein
MTIMAERPIVTNPNAVANVTTALGGVVIPGRTFMVDLPQEDVREFVPKIRDTLGLGCRRVSERVAEHPRKLGCTQNIVTLELYKP